MAYTSIISQINWIANGEKASSVVLNRPLLEFLAKYETGVFDLASANVSIFADPSIIGASVTDGALVSLQIGTGKIVNTDRTNYKNILGIADVTNSRIYIKGVIDRAIVVANNASIATDTIPTKYYANYTVGQEGKLSTTISGNSPYVGVTLDYNGAAGGEKLLIDISKTAANDTFTTTATQTVFNTVYDPNNVDVYVEGIQLTPSEYTATDGLTITIPSVVQFEQVNIITS